MKRVAWLGCGGCVSARDKSRDNTGDWEPTYRVDEVIEKTSNYYSEKAKQVELATEDVFLMWGEDMNYDHFKKVANRALPRLEDKEIDGVVISQGSDTLKYAALFYALAFGRTLNKPVTMLYTMRYIQKDPEVKGLFEDTEIAAKYISDAIEISAYSGVNEVIVPSPMDEEYTGTRLLRGARVVEARNNSVNAFETFNNELPIATLQDSKFTFDPDYNFPVVEGEPRIINDKFRGGNIGYFMLTGEDSSLFINSHNYDAILLSSLVNDFSAMGDGGVFGNGKTIYEIRKKIDEGIPVFVAPFYYQGYGKISLSTTNLDKGMRDCGVIPLGDMSCQHALTKIGWVLGQTGDLEEIKRMMQTNYVDEITPGSFDEISVEEKLDYEKEYMDNWIETSKRFPVVQRMNEKAKMELETETQTI